MYPRDSVLVHWYSKLILVKSTLGKSTLGVFPVGVSISSWYCPCGATSVFNVHCTLRLCIPHLSSKISAFCEALTLFMNKTLWWYRPSIDLSIFGWDGSKQDVNNHTLFKPRLVVCNSYIFFKDLCNFLITQYFEQCPYTRTCSRHVKF